MAKKSAPSSSKKPVATHKHADTRTNIPTEERRDFVDPAEQQTKVLYPRDLSSSFLLVLVPCCDASASLPGKIESKSRSKTES